MVQCIQKEGKYARRNERERNIREESASQRRRTIIELGVTVTQKICVCLCLSFVFMHDVYARYPNGTFESAFFVCACLSFLPPFS
jgi:hypothetical protein